MAKKSKSHDLDLSEGSPVRVRTWKKDGVIIDVLKNGQFKVSLGSMVVQCKAADLEAAKQSSKKQARPMKRASSVVTVREIDLHGFTVEQALKTVEQAVNDAIMAGCNELQIVHGHGTGKLKSAIHEFLKQLDVVKSFKLSEMNSGMTRAFF